ncbi:hypothetical protein JVT61DRAFT_11379 [Boletus reticuloceps]|uniref:Uncharacterized protein n=1 Tax=Boletus reticuloceps TaxID=495285 RepID=A0A8I2YES5_9AGAM|nr:hypothetical protein JVT61DRAFT_11379 [Boletus reticuloceps]
MQKRAAEGEEGGTKKATDATSEASQRDPDLLQGNIQRCSAALQQVLEHLEIQTRWKFSVLMGGPDPMDPEGTNIIASLHVGKTKGDKDFAGVYAGFDTTVIEAYGEFLAEVFSRAGESAVKTTEGCKEKALSTDNGDEDNNDRGKGKDKDKDEDKDQDQDDGNAANDDDDINDTDVSKEGGDKEGDDGERDDVATFTMSPPSCLATPPVPSGQVLLPSSTAISMALPNHTAPLPPSDLANSSALVIPPSTNLASSQDHISPLLPHHDVIGSVNGPALMTNPMSNLFDVTNSFISLSNGNDFAFPQAGSMLGNSWNPFAPGMGANMMNLMPLGMGAVSNVGSGLSLSSTNHNGLVTSGFQHSPVNPLHFNPFPDINAFQFPMVGDMNYGLNAAIQNPYNFIGIPDASSISAYATIPVPVAHSQLVPPMQATTPPASLPLPLLPSPPGPSPPALSSPPHFPGTSLQQPLSNIVHTPAPFVPPTQPVEINLRHTQAAVMGPADDTSLGRSKWKPIPSLCAARDNFIGNENRVPHLETEGTKGGKTGKCMRETESFNRTPTKKNTKKDKVTADREPRNAAPKNKKRKVSKEN